MTFARYRESLGLEESLTSVAKGLIRETSGFNPVTADNFGDPDGDEREDDVDIE